MKELTFSRQVKNEVALLQYEDEALKPLLSGIIRVSGTIVLGHNTQLKIQTEIVAVADLIYDSFKRAYGVEPLYQYGKKTHFDKATVYIIVVTERVMEILKDLECFDDFFRMHPKEMMRGDNLRYLVIGMFLGGGMISDPAKAHYYLELTFNDEDDAKVVLKKLQSFKGGKKMGFKLIQRREKSVLYLKRSDEISVFLVYIGAQYMMMEFENTRLTRDYTNSQNRLTICDIANYQKAAKTAKENLDDIAEIEQRVGLFAFDEKTRLAIRLRQENIDVSYSEIANLMVENNVQITKSGVVHIFKKLHEFAEKLRNGHL